MGQIKTDFIESLTINKPDIFVETGTYLGGTPLMMLVDKSFKKWKKIYTIELSEKCCKIASTRYKLYEQLGINHDFKEKWSKEEDSSFVDRKSYFEGKLNLLNGNSAKRLKDVLSEVKSTCAFWLDAHAGSRKEYERGDEDCPLISELKAIRAHNIKNHFIAIDDAHMFGQKQYKNGEIVCDYSHITKDLVEDTIKSINSNYTIEYKTPYSELMLIAYEKKQTKISSSLWWNK